MTWTAAPSSSMATMRAGDHVVRHEDVGREPDEPGHPRDGAAMVAVCGGHQPQVRALHRVAETDEPIDCSEIQTSCGADGAVGRPGRAEYLERRHAKAA